MSRADYTLSLILHLLFIITVIILSSTSPRVSTDIDDTIIIGIRSLTLPAPVIEPQIEQIKEPTPTIPKAIEADDDIAFVTDPTTVDTEKEIQPKPQEETKPKDYRPQAEPGAETRAGAVTDSSVEISEAVVGTRFGGLAVDNASFNYPYWFDAALRKIDRNWTNPVYSSTALQCTISFQVISSGRILKVEIGESSGIPAFDRACKRAVERSRPLPPLPPEYADELLGVHLVFPYIPG